MCFGSSFAPIRREHYLPITFEKSPRAVNRSRECTAAGWEASQWRLRTMTWGKKWTERKRCLRTVSRKSDETVFVYKAPSKTALCAIGVMFAKCIFSGNHLSVSSCVRAGNGENGIFIFSAIGSFDGCPVCFAPLFDVPSRVTFDI